MHEQVVNEILGFPCLLTPPVTDGALDGVTRRCVIELAANAGMSMRETSLAPYDVYTADECFLTGTGAELIPVREIRLSGANRLPRPGLQYAASALRRFGCRGDKTD